MTGVSLAWPSGLYAALLWTLYLIIRRGATPDLARTIREVEAVAIPFLTQVSAFPIVLFASGVVGGILGRVVLRGVPTRLRPPEPGG